jgi:DNA invertase Pin-like site-specific DNA recombinase
MPKTAYSYIRFSTPDQIVGDSLRRQTAAAKAICERHNWTLDESLNLRDLGVSAFRGKNAQEGALGRFIEAIDSGRVKKGSVLIVEKLDRLTRLEPDDAYQLVRSILKKGVLIASVEPENILDQNDLKDGMRILMLIVRLILGNEESQKKSDRGSAARENKRSRIRDAAKSNRPMPIMTSACPGWLQLSDDGTKFVPVPAKVAIVKQIFRATLEGTGLSKLTSQLNKSGVPSISRIRTRKTKGDHTWHRSYLVKIIHNRAVLGEYQPHSIQNGKRRPAGEPIPGYFPAIICETDFYRAQDIMTKRGSQRGPTGKSVANLFTGLIHDARDGATMTLVKKSAITDTGLSSLVSSTAQRGVKDSVYLSFPYHLFERAFLRLTSELKLRDILPHEHSVDDEIEAINAKLTGIEKRIVSLKKRLATDPNFDELADVLKGLVGQREACREQLEAIKATASHDVAAGLSETQSIVETLDKASGEELVSLRTRLKSRIQQLVSDIWMIVQPVPRGRMAWAQIFFAGGGVRIVSVYYDDCLIASDGIVEKMKTQNDFDLRSWRTHAQENLTKVLMDRTLRVTEGYQRDPTKPVLRKGSIEIELVKLNSAFLIRPMLAQYPNASPKWIAEHLCQRGFKVTAMQVSYTRFNDKRRNS